jgi:trehalose-phosphatase
VLREWEELDGLLRREAALRPLLIGLDFDGTLAPMTARPDLAAMPARTRSLIERLCRDERIKVAVLSGRALEDLKARVGVDGPFYSGNHGLEIERDSSVWRHPGASETAAELARLGESLRAELAPFRGVLVEDKGLSLSVHFRLAAPSHHAPLRLRMAELLRRTAARVRLSLGHMVWEVRPRVPWNKGHALLGIERRLGRPHGLVMIGDDRTDEEAFRTLGTRAVTVRVSPTGRSSARFRLAGPEEVARLLGSLLLSRPS